MNSLYKSIGISKQAFHQKMDRLQAIRSEQAQLLLLIWQIRQDHPTMGVRDMYFKIRPQHIGRDAFEHFCRSENLMSEKNKNWRRTTDSTGVVRFDNMLIDLDINKINQVWQSDITYFEVNQKFYYITLIIDAYSRRIVGHHTSKRLTTEQTTLPALKMAIKLRKMILQSIVNLIFHSDGGGQYYDKEFLKLTHKQYIINSMCEFAWENGKAERLNGIIKNNYLKHRTINSFEDLQKEVDRSVYLYNNEKPHIELQRKSPVEFEKNYICIGQQTDGDKSATELNAQSEGYYSPSGCGQQTSDSNIALELNGSKSEKRVKTVNVI
ncbi:IS3 family transposase [Candidatus Parcubacteria bacterium]|nr:IS3 family transposase [Candidatus Parcubacteria bacterium]